MSLNRTVRLAGLATATSALALSMPAFAQDEAASEDDSSGNNIIVVTAQKREQNLQDVPISITAFDTEGLENARLTGVQDIDKLVPGLLTTPNPADANGVRINIRGVGTFDPQIGQDSRVAIYLDGAYLGRTQGLAFDSPDLERAEIVKGPQGTLYGRNAVAGAVNLILAKPDTSEFAGKLTAEYGRFDHRKLAGYVNVPLGDQVAVRLSASYQEEDGWVENLGLGTDFGGGERFSFRAAFGFDFSDDVRLDLAADHSSAQTEPFFYQAVAGFADPVVPTFFGAAITPVAGRQNTATTTFANERGDLDTTGITATLSWDFSDDHNFKLLGSYRKAEAASFVALLPEANPFILNGIINAPIPGVGLSVNGAFGGAAAAAVGAGAAIRPGFDALFTPSLLPGPQTGLFLSPPGAANQLDDHEQFSIEATFTGEFSDGAIQYTAGVFYYDEDTGNDPNQARNPNDLSSLLLSLGSLPDAFTVALTPAPFLPFTGAATTFSEGLAQIRNTAAAPLRIQTEAFAIYGELTWNITDQLSITGGLRYSNESKDGQGQPISPFFFDNIDLAGGLIDPNIASISFDVLDPSFIIEYEPSDNFLVYASYKESFRSGGFNQAAIAPNLPGQTFGADFIFGTENLTAYEAGLKLDTLDNRLRLNIAGFYYDISDQQTTAATNATIATERVVVNVDEEIWGLEFDALFSLTDSFSINASYAWIDGDAGDVPNLIAADGSFLERDDLQGTPKHSFVIGGNFNTQLSSGIGLFANANYSYKEGVIGVPAATPDALDVRLSSRNLVSARLGLDIELSSGSTARISIWGENILDDRYTVDALPFETFAERVVVFGQPATYGVTASIEF